jgi:hypothetical protein
MKQFKKILPIVLYILICACNTNAPKPKTAEELRQELKSEEQANPLRYLSISGNLRENVTQESGFLRSRKTDGYILSGSIKNSASIAKFKDAVVIVSYLSETQTAMETKEYIMYKYFNPNSEMPYEYKVYPPEGFKSFSIEIKTATPSN